MIRTSCLAIATACLMGAASLGACGPQDTGPFPSVGSVSQAYSTVVDLISPSTCAARGTRLISCAIAPIALSGLSMTTAVPLRTTFTVQRSGNCSTQYPLEVTLKAEGAEDVKFQYLGNAKTSIKRKDGQSIASVSLVDSSPWTRYAAFDQSCRLSLGIASNEVAVDNKADAQAIIDTLEQDVAAKTGVRDHYRELTLYHRAFQFLQSVSNSFRTELTNETIQQLRFTANDSLDAISRLMSTCDATLSDADRQNLMLLFMSLPQLGSADDWRLPDGGSKTLADFVGVRANEVLATVQKLSEKADNDGGASDYDALYTQAAQAVVEATSMLTLARAQLASWLT